MLVDFNVIASFIVLVIDGLMCKIFVWKFEIGKNFSDNTFRSRNKEPLIFSHTVISNVVKFFMNVHEDFMQTIGKDTCPIVDKDMFISSQEICIFVFV